MPSRLTNSLIALLGAATNASAQESGASAGQFKAWVLALEWQPGWNAAEPHANVVAHTVPGAYAANHMSLHGLWPQYSTTDSKYPQFCKGSAGDYTQCEAKHNTPSLCRPSEQTLQAFNTTDHWQKYAMEYSYSDLADHEWPKHGSCTGWDQQKFFSVVEKTLMKALDSDGLKFISANTGSKVSLKQLEASFPKKVDLVCNRCTLQELRMLMTADPTTNEPADLVDHLQTGGGACSVCDEVQILAVGQDPEPVPTPVGQCVHNQLGPACAYDHATAGTDKDSCTKLQGCTRCARSGHCTMVPMDSSILV